MQIHVSNIRCDFHSQAMIAGPGAAVASQVVPSQLDVGVLVPVSPLTPRSSNLSYASPKELFRSGSASASVAATVKPSTELTIQASTARPPAAHASSGSPLAVSSVPSASSPVIASNSTNGVSTDLSVSSGHDTSSAERNGKMFDDAVLLSLSTASDQQEEEEKAVTVTANDEEEEEEQEDEGISVLVPDWEVPVVLATVPKFTLTVLFVVTFRIRYISSHRCRTPLTQRQPWFC